MYNHGILQQKLAKKDGASIDRQNDIQVLWNFYLDYKSRRRVDDMQREQERLRESGTFSTEYGHSLLRDIDIFFRADLAVEFLKMCHYGLLTSRLACFFTEKRGIRPVQFY